MQKSPFLSLLFVGCALYAQAEDGVEQACARLTSALEQQVVALEGITDTASSQQAVPTIRESLRVLEDLFSVGETAMWQYIDHTEGVKLPLIELMQRLAVQFGRLEETSYFGNAELKVLLSPQMEQAPALEMSKQAN